LEKQAQAIGIPLKIVWVPENPDMAIYATRMTEALLQFKAEGINLGIFGDIFLTDLKKYREAQMSQLGMKAVFPLWNENPLALVQEFVQLGFRAQLVCVSEKRLGKAFLNRTLDLDFLRSLPAGVDPAGENGEYHTFVYAGPLLSEPIKYNEGEIIYRDYAAAQSANPENKIEAEAEKQSNQHTPPAIDTEYWFADLLPANNRA
jgi:uncharacterized protein (TIGR00290 family)